MSTPYSFDEMLKQASFKIFFFKSLIKEKKKKVSLQINSNAP